MRFSREPCEEFPGTRWRPRRFFGTIVRPSGLIPICFLTMMSARCRSMFVARFLKLLLLGSWGFLPIWAAPKITDFAPPFGAPGATITIFGTGLGKVNAVNFNGAQATLTFVGPTALQVIVPLTAVNGPIFVRDSDGFTYDSGAALLPDFLTTPRIATVKRVFPPANTPEEEVRLAPGNIVEVTGANYLSFTDPRFQQEVRVEFTGPNGPIRIVPNSVGSTILQATVPNGAISGPLTVLTPIGSAQTAGDLYFQPIVTSFTPVAPVNAVIELVGRSFKGATQVLFGTQLVTPLTVSATNLTVRVPLITGPVRLTLFTPGGAFMTAGNFALAPTINAFAPAGGSSGQTGFGSLADQVAFELAQRAEHMEDESAARGRGVDGFGQRAEANTTRFQPGDRFNQVRQRTTEPI